MGLILSPIAFELFLSVIAAIWAIHAIFAAATATITFRFALVVNHFDFRLSDRGLRDGGSFNNLAFFIDYFDKIPADEISNIESGFNG